jgi:hypothetical protein
MLPLDDFERLVPGRGGLPTNDRPVILVCILCKHANIYSPLESSPYYDPGWQRIQCFRGGATDRVVTLKCVGENNEFQAPLVVTWIDGMTEGEKIERAEPWIGGHLKCPAGHAIPWPWRQDEVA